MSFLPSQQSASQAGKLLFPMLQDNSSHAAFSKGSKDYCQFNHGKIGQHFTHGIETVLAIQGTPPHYSDSKLHPISGMNLFGTRKYARVDATAAQLADLDFDHDTLPLTTDGQSKFDVDMSNYNKVAHVLLAEFTLLKGQDDDLLKILNDHVSPTAKSQITITPEYAAWKLLGFSSVSRAHHFKLMIDTLFSKGNSKESVAQGAILFGLKQSGDQLHPAAFLNQVNDQVLTFAALFEDPATPGFIATKRIHTMVMINGLSQHSEANKEGLKEHLRLHPLDALDVPAELISNLVKAHQSDTNSDRIADQSSAFAATLSSVNVNPSVVSSANTLGTWIHHSNNPDFSAIAGLTPCSNCLKLTKKYFYSHNPLSCNRTAASEAAKRQAHQDKKKFAQPKLQAHVASIASPANSPVPTTPTCPAPSTLTKDATLALLHCGVENPAFPGLTKAQCFSFLAMHHPEVFDDA